MKRIILLLGLFGVFIVSLNAQALRGTTGLLHAPTADMEVDKTFKFGANVLDVVPLHYLNFRGEISHTYNYYFDVTIFPWLEVSYICTLNYAVHGSTYFPKQSWGKYTNQDRQFSGRLRLWKEGWWKSWTPQIVVGVDDASSHVAYGGGTAKLGDGQNNFFTRFYLAATKHVDFQAYGILGVHAAYVVGRGKGLGGRYEGPTMGANFRFQLPQGGSGLFSGGKFNWQQIVNSFNLMAEYDALTVNVGGTYSIWKDRLNLVGELNDGKYLSGGVQVKVHLK